MKLIMILLMANVCFAGTKPGQKPIAKSSVVKKIAKPNTSAKPNIAVRALDNKEKICALVASIKTPSPRIDQLKKVNGCK